jgi:polyisoprenoid-binding protein YceI
MISNNKNARPMKININSILIVFLALLMVPAFAQVPYKSKTVKLTVNGTSSLHDWESDVTKVEWRGSFLVESSEVKEVANVTVKIPVTSIKSTKGKIMDNKTYDAFKSEKYPYIIFKMNKSQITGGNGTQTIKTEGALTMAGKTKQVTLTVKVKTLPNGDLQLTGSYPIKMTEYSMEPPTAMMGAIKVGEEVTVNFDLTVTDTNELSN